jgi:hypothetical protein
MENNILFENLNSLNIIIREHLKKLINCIVNINFFFFFNKKYMFFYSLFLKNSNSNRCYCNRL